MTTSKHLFIDQWLVERILEEGHIQEINNLKGKIKEGLRVRDANGCFISFESVVKSFKQTKKKSK